MCCVATFCIIDAIDFHAPVSRGNIIYLMGHMTFTSAKSMEIEVIADAQDLLKGERAIMALKTAAVGSSTLPPVTTLSCHTQSPTPPPPPTPSHIYVYFILLHTHKHFPDFQAIASVRAAHFLRSFHWIRPTALKPCRSSSFTRTRRGSVLRPAENGTKNASDGGRASETTEGVQGPIWQAGAKFKFLQ